MEARWKNMEISKVMEAMRKKYGNFQSDGRNARICEILWWCSNADVLPGQLQPTPRSMDLLSVCLSVCVVCLSVCLFVSLSVLSVFVNLLSVTGATSTQTVDLLSAFRWCGFHSNLIPELQNVISRTFQIISIPPHPPPLTPRKILIFIKHRHLTKVLSQIPSSLKHVCTKTAGLEYFPHHSYLKWFEPSLYTHLFWLIL